jgi:hypothetical protein
MSTPPTRAFLYSRFIETGKICQPHYKLTSLGFTILTEKPPKLLTSIQNQSIFKGGFSGGWQIFLRLDPTLLPPAFAEMLRKIRVMDRSVKGVKEWLWVIANSNFCLFHAADTRSRAELEHLLGTEYRGVLSSDDFSVYNGYCVAAQQKCLAHLRRHFLRLIQRPGEDNAMSR